MIYIANGDKKSKTLYEHFVLNTFQEQKPSEKYFKSFRNAVIRTVCAVGLLLGKLYSLNHRTVSNAVHSKEIIIL